MTVATADSTDRTYSRYRTYGVYSTHGMRRENGTRMNRRLHHLPFRALQFYTSYKASLKGIPTAWINPEYTTNGVRCMDIRSVRTATRSGSNAGRVPIKTTAIVVQASTSP